MPWAYQCQWEYTSPTDLLRKTRTVTFISQNRIPQAFAINATRQQVIGLVNKYERTPLAEGIESEIELEPLGCREAEI